MIIVSYEENYAFSPSKWGISVHEQQIYQQAGFPEIHGNFFRGVGSLAEPVSEREQALIKT
jgi:hypothetical protein